MFGLLSIKVIRKSQTQSLMFSDNASNHQPVAQRSKAWLNTLIVQKKMS